MIFVSGYQHQRVITFNILKEMISMYNFSPLSLLLILTALTFSSVDSTRIVITNNCSFTVWAAAYPGGGKRLSHGDTWTLPDLPSGRRGRIWGRTNCAGLGRGGKCESGDCSGLLECAAKGRPPNTVVEYSIDKSESDEFSVSVSEGFNIPIQFGAAASSSAVCKESVRCAADINAPCPMELRDPGGCNSPCTVFQNDQFCCATAAGDCGPTTYSEFFEKLCPQAVSYPYDVPAKTRRCQTGIEYSLVFCPDEAAASPELEYNPVFEIQNNCSYTVWAAAIPGGSRRLESGERWFINENKGIVLAKIWGRTNCSFDAAGKGKCETGDCGGVFECTVNGKPPTTIAEYALNQFQNLDFFDISLVDGFNIPMEFVPTSNGCVRGPRCAGERISRECPAELRVPGGCNNPCTVFGTAEMCGPTTLSRFFKDRCPDAYSDSMDNATFICPGGTYYKAIFCP